MSFRTHTPPPTCWSATRKPLSPEDWQEAVARAGEQLATLPLALARDRAKVSDLARKALLAALADRGFASVPEEELAPHLSQVISQVGGLRFLDPLIPPHCDDYTDIQLNADGSVWARPWLCLGRRGGENYLRRFPSMSSDTARIKTTPLITC